VRLREPGAALNVIVERAAGDGAVDVLDQPARTVRHASIVANRYDINDLGFGRRFARRCAVSVLQVTGIVSVGTEPLRVATEGWAVAWKGLLRLANSGHMSKRLTAHTDPRGEPMLWWYVAIVVIYAGMLVLACSLARAAAQSDEQRVRAHQRDLWGFR